MLEIERTFLVKKLPADLSRFKASKIRQGYISPSPSPLRVRQRDNKFEITKKFPLKDGDWSSAEEINIPLKEEEFNKFWPLAKASLEKTRYVIPLENNLIAELDIFEGKLKGLVFVEVEFPSSDEMEKFVPLDWFGPDITQEDFSANSFLAGKTFEEIEKIINVKKLASQGEALRI